jgi:hypothetical protein
LANKPRDSTIAGTLDARLGPENLIAAWDQT